MGGDNFDLNKLQTLCHECHVRKTIADMARLREANSIPFILRDFYGMLERVERNQERWKGWSTIGKIV
jgi:hypothetical protein